MSCLDKFGDSIKLFRDPTRGGVATTLTEIAESCGKGIFIQEKNISLDPSVEGACEMLGLDPLYVANEGVYWGIGHSATIWFIGLVILVFKYNISNTSFSKLESIGNIILN